ncbi:MAG: radical SAM protein [Planctomycetes bacterium]|nr:radical SAM protein [Planctomycetota bacterium]
MASLSRIKNYLLAKGLESVVPMLSSHSPSTLITAMDKLRQVGIKRMTEQHKGTPEELVMRIDAANAFFEMAKRKLPHLSRETQKKLVNNMFVNAINLGDEKRDEYFAKHGEYPPFFLLISPSMACNLRCFGCYAWKHPKSKSLSFEKMDEIITEAKEDMGIYFISITGGEPTVWEPLERLIQKHDDVFFQMYTHGMNIDDAMAKRFAEYGNIYPAISIEGSEQFTDARRGEGAYKRILEAMDNLNRHGVLFGFSITHTSVNHESVTSGDFMDTLIKHGAAFGWYFQYIPIGRDPEMSLVPSPEQRLERREVCKNLRKEKPVLVYDFWNDGDACQGCIAWGRRYVHITAQGLVEPCVFVHFAKDSVHDKSLGEILRSDAFRYMRGRQPFTTDLRAPCPQIDHPKELKTVVEKFGMVPTHEGAENIVTEHHEIICKNAEAWKKCLADYDKAKAELGENSVKPSTEAAGD